MDNAACRQLFSELEFTTLLKELAPATDNAVISYELKPTPKQIAQLIAEARAINPGTNLPNGLAVAIFEDARAIAEEIAEPAEEEIPELEPPPAQNMSLFGTSASAAPASENTASDQTQDPASKLGLAVSDTFALEAAIDIPGIKEALADPTLPKDVHDLKAILRALAPHNMALEGVRNDVMLLSYLVNQPTAHTPYPTSPPAAPAALSSTRPPR